VKRIITIGVLVLTLISAWAMPAFAAPNDSAAHVALCATSMGGQHVASCAQNMDRGVSTCATMPQSQCTL
jgi:hypothetical protein